MGVRWKYKDAEESAAAHNERRLVWNKANPVRRYPLSERRYRLMRQYGITLEEVDNVPACMICGRSFVHQKDRHVDHNHQTGKYRGILCRSCNWGLGYFFDTPAILREAARYLEEREED